ncbi:MAG: Trk system potassium transporter TrkA [Clostridia bacterium]|nr:Trk system potassium transporter TrkA [Clostridia bacterium]
MNIMIVGCGKVGQTLAEQLNDEGNNITVVDTDPELVSDLAARLDIMGYVGNGATHTVQQEAGIHKTDLLIAVTGSDELNLLCCLIAKKAGNCQTIARVKNPAYSSETAYLKDELGLAMVINPEHAAAAEIARVLRFPSAIKIDTFAHGRVELFKYRIPEGSILSGMAVKDVVAKLSCDVLVCTVERGDESYIANGNFVFAEKDTISVIASPKNALEFFKAMGYKNRAVRDVMVIGGGETAQYLCSILHRSGVSIKIIEKDQRVCSELCVRFPEVSIIHGDAADQSLLLEEGIRTASAFVALTGLDEENIFLSLFAKSAGHAKVVTKINRIAFDDVIKHLDLDSTIYPKNITADLILRYVRAMKNSEGSSMETLYSVIHGQVEAAEYTVGEGSPVTEIPLMKLKKKPDILIAAIIREGKVLIPRGGDMILAGDRVVVVTRAKAIDDIADILL